MKAIGIILAGGKNERLGLLTEERANSALPIGGTYRAVDFSLSNMTNSGIGKVAVITQFNSRSLHDHLSSSKWWDFGRKHGGLFVFTPFQSYDKNFWFRGTADSMHQNLTYLLRSNEPYVVIAPGESIYKIDFNEAIEYHISKHADITIICKDMGGRDIRDFGVMDLDGTGRMVEFEEKPDEPQSQIASMGMYIMSRPLLIKLLEQVIAEGRYDFVKDIIIRYRRSYRIYGYLYDGYWATINSVSSYYQANMDFLSKSVRSIFFRQSPYVESKPKDEAPAKYNARSKTRNVITGSGSIINGDVENSVLFRNVFVGDDTRIANSIIMEGSNIGKGCIVEHAIFDKEVVLCDGKSVIGKPGAPVIVRKHSMI